jgi:hypothetical protein
MFAPQERRLILGICLLLLLGAVVKSFRQTTTTESLPPEQMEKLERLPDETGADGDERRD